MIFKIDRSIHGHERVTQMSDSGLVLYELHPALAMTYAMKIHESREDRRNLPVHISQQCVVAT